MFINVLVMVKDGAVRGMEPVADHKQAQNRVADWLQSRGALRIVHMIPDEDDESNRIATYTNEHEPDVIFELWWSGLECTRPETIINRT